jgi:hypothetical protein
VRAVPERRKRSGTARAVHFHRVTLDPRQGIASAVKLSLDVYPRFPGCAVPVPFFLAAQMSARNVSYFFTSDVLYGMVGRDDSGQYNLFLEVKELPFIAPA